jgi:hypothetical protein
MTYALSRAQAAFLLAIVDCPLEQRQAALVDYAAQHGPEATASLFAQYIGLDSSVADNCRTAVEVFAIVEGGMHPYTAELLNLPTIAGACNSAMLADGIDLADHVPALVGGVDRAR